VTTQLQLINIIIIIIIIISFLQGIYTYIPETNYVPREYSVAAILLLLLMVLISLVSVLNVLYFYISTEWHKRTGTFEMLSDSHVQLAALRNRDLELQTTLPSSNHGTVERSVSSHGVIGPYLYLQEVIFVGFFKSSRFFCLSLYFPQCVCSAQCGCFL